jgi:hypothetical protein
MSISLIPLKHTATHRRGANMMNPCEPIRLHQYPYWLESVKDEGHYITHPSKILQITVAVVELHSCAYTLNQDNDLLYCPEAACPDVDCVWYYVGWTDGIDAQAYEESLRAFIALLQHRQWELTIAIRNGSY